MADIVAKVLASSVTETDEPGDGYGPVADEMDLFGSESMPGEEKAGAVQKVIGGSAEDGDADPEFDDDDF